MSVPSDSVAAQAANHEFSRVVYSGPISEQGVFSLPSDLPYPRLVTAKLGDVAELQRLLDGPLDQYVELNLIEHLITQDRFRHPERSRRQSELAVRQGLNIPPNVATNHLNGSSASPFSAQLFLQTARTQGGFQAFCLDLLNRFDRGETLAFVPVLNFEVAVLDFAISGLIGNLAADPFVLAETAAIGWVAGKLGYENSTEKELDNISAQIDDVLNEISELESTLKVNNLTAQFQQDQQALAPIYLDAESQNQEVSETASEQASLFSTTTNLGPQVPSVATGLVNLFLQFDASSEMETVTGYLLGKNSPYPGTTGLPNIVEDYNAYMQAVHLGEPNTSTNYYNYTTRSDTYTEEFAQTNLDYYRALLALLGNLIAENAHATTLPQTASGYSPPAATLNEAYRTLMTAAATARLAQHQVPQPFGYAFYADTSGGKLWSTQAYESVGTDVHGNLDPQGVQDVERKLDYAFPLGPIQGPLVLPSVSDLQTLYNRAVRINPDIYPSGSYQQMGFPYGLPQYVLTSDSRVFRTDTGQVVTPQYQQVSTVGFYQIPSTPGNGFSGSMLLFGLGQKISSSYLTVTLSADGSRVTATTPDTDGQTPVDITDQVAWSSSDTSVVDVSNITTPEDSPLLLVPGQLIFHKEGSATVTATVAQGTGAVSTSVQVTSPGAPALTGVLLSPQNVRYQSLPQPLGLGGYGQQFYFTGFLEDGTAVDLTPQATFRLWQLPNSTPVDPESADTSGLTEISSSLAAFQSGSQGFLTINSNSGQSPFVNGNLLVTATYTDPGSGRAWTQSAQLLMPQGTSDPNAPAITSLDPTSSTTAGGRLMTIRGLRFNGTTSVTFGGTPAVFTVNTNSQITATIPAAASSGTVDLVVTTPDGSATAAFVYR